MNKYRERIFNLAKDKGGSIILPEVQDTRVQEARLELISMGFNVLDHEEFLDKAEMIMSRVSVESLQETFKDISIKAKNEIRHLIADFDGEDIEIIIKLKDGKASKEIIDFSNEISPDLIVMGSNGKDSISDYIMGTTTSYVVDNSKYPVLVIPDMLK